MSPRIDLTSLAQLSALSDIEHSAAQAFRRLPALAWVADEAPTDAARHRAGIAQQTHWIARRPDGQPCGFLCAEPIGQTLHLWELSVALPDQGQGLGRALILAAVRHASQHGRQALTLTTFCAPAWNAPWYARQGFMRLDDASLKGRLRALRQTEVASQRPGAERCAMRQTLKASAPAA